MLREDKKLINGKEFDIGIIGRRNDRETYVFMHHLNPWAGDYLVYGVDWDVIDGQIRGIDKFRDHFTNARGFFNRYYVSTHYGRFYETWGLNNRNNTTFRVCSGGAGPGGCHESKYITDTWDFGKRVKLKPRERQDIKLIFDNLRKSHIDFSVIGKMYETPRLEFKYLGEDPREIVKRELAKLENAPSTRENAAAAWGSRYCATHPRVEDRAIINQPARLIIRRQYTYGDSRAFYTYEFENGKKETMPGDSLFFLKDPKPGEAHFIIGVTGANFLDEFGNEIGDKISFPDYLERFEGVFRDSRGRDVPYSFLWQDNYLFDSSGNKVAQLLRDGFIIGN